MGGRLIVCVFPGIGLLFIGEASQIVHAGIQRNCQFSALFKGKIPFATFDFGIVALVNSGHHLNFYLCESFFFAQVPNSTHIYHLMLLWQISLLKIG